MDKTAKLRLPFWVWGSVVVIIVLLALAGLIIYFHPKVNLPDGLDKTNYIIIALVAFIGSPFFIWRTILTSIQTEIQQESEHTKNYFEAMKHLDFEDGKNDEKITARAGAIYELGKIAKNSKDHNSQITTLLVSYLAKNHDEKSPQRESNVDIKAVIEVIGNINKETTGEVKNG